jgi:hypothetical protein
MRMPVRLVTYAAWACFWSATAFTVRTNLLGTALSVETNLPIGAFIAPSSRLSAC